MVKKTSVPVASKPVSPAVAKAVQTTVAAPEPVKTRGEKKFSSEQYLTEYLVEQKAGGTWESLCARTGFTKANVVQCITMLRSEYRAAKIEAASASAAFLKQLKANGIDIEIWADNKAAEKFPYMGGDGSRNTKKAQLRKSWEQEELSL